MNGLVKVDLGYINHLFTYLLLLHAFHGRMLEKATKAELSSFMCVLYGVNFA